MTNPLTLTFNGRDGLTIEAYRGLAPDATWAWEVGTRSDHLVHSAGCASEAEAMAAGIKAALGVLETWAGELRGMLQP